VSCVFRLSRSPTDADRRCPRNSSPASSASSNELRSGRAVAFSVGEDAHEPHNPVAAAIAARSILAVFAVTLEQVGMAALEGKSPRTARGELTATIETAAVAGTLALGRRRVKRRWPRIREKRRNK
jgi:hypothetical protein